MRASPDNRARSRKQVLRYLREAIRGVPRGEGPGGVRLPGLRDIYQGFSREDGYDLRHIQRWSLARVQRVQELAKELNHLTSVPFRVMTPRTRQQKQTLRSFTRQFEPTQRRYIVHVETRNYAVRFARRGKQLEIFRPERFGGYGRMRFWMFADYLGYQAETQDEFIEATTRMLPDMPDWGFFSLWGTYGVMGTPQPKKSLLAVLAQYFSEGDSFSPEKMEEGLGAVLQGWVLQGDEEDHLRILDARTSRRRVQSRWQKKQRRLRHRYLYTPAQRRQMALRDTKQKLQQNKKRLKMLQRIEVLERQRKRMEMKSRKKKRSKKKAKGKK